jgi:hypothetical protein
MLFAIMDGKEIVAKKNVYLTLIFLVCPSDCNDRGVCRNGTCFCNNGYTGETCNIICMYGCHGHGYLVFFINIFFEIFNIFLILINIILK